MSERAYERLSAEVESWLQMCGSCDAALPMGCTCPKGDYRNILLKVWTAYEEAIGIREEPESVHASGLQRELDRLEHPYEQTLGPDELED